jgi:hypothetical protein
MLMLELEATGCKGKGKRQAIICLGHCKTLEQGPIDAWRRERVGRTSTTVEAIGEALAWSRRRQGPDRGGGGAVSRSTQKRSGCVA